MTDLTFSMPDGREERQTNRQTTLTWTIFKKPDVLQSNILHSKLTPWFQYQI